jgi:hypothetical protein
MYPHRFFIAAQLNTVYRRIQQYRLHFKPIQRDAFATWLAERATYYFDAGTLKKDLAPDVLEDIAHPLKLARRDYQNDIDNDVKRSWRHPENDFSFEVVLFPYGRNVYGIVYTEKEEFRNDFLKKVGGSWLYGEENTDFAQKREKVLFLKQEKAWEVVLGNGVPAERGLSVRLGKLRPDIGILEKELMPFIPSLEKRAKSFVQSAGVAEFAAIHDPEMKRGVNTIHNAITWMSDNPAEVARLRGIIIPKLKPTITEFDLLGFHRDKTK